MKENSGTGWGDGDNCRQSVTGERIFCCANGKVRLPGQVASLLQPLITWATGQLIPGSMCVTRV